MYRKILHDLNKMSPRYSEQYGLVDGALSVATTYIHLLARLTVDRRKPKKADDDDAMSTISVRIELIVDGYFGVNCFVKIRRNIKRVRRLTMVSLSFCRERLP